MQLQVGGRTDIPPEYVPSPAPADTMSRAVEMLWVRERAKPKERAGAQALLPCLCLASALTAWCRTCQLCGRLVLGTISSLCISASSLGA